METARDHVAETLLILGLYPAVLHGGAAIPAQSYYAAVEHLTKALKQLDDAALAADHPLPPAPEGWNPDDSTVAT